MTTMTNMNVGDGLRRANDAADCIRRTVDDGRRQDHGTVNSANCAANTGSDSAADNVAHWAGYGTTTIGTVLSAADNTLGMGDEWSSKHRQCGNG